MISYKEGVAIWQASKMISYKERVAQLEAEGCTTSDAQSVADCEVLDGLVESDRIFLTKGADNA